MIRLSVLPASDKSLDAEVVNTTAIRTSSTAPAILPSSFAPDTRIPSQPKDAENSNAPAVENTIEAEIVDTPAVQTFDIHVESQPTPKQNPPQVRMMAATTSELQNRERRTSVRRNDFPPTYRLQPVVVQ